MYVKHQVLDHKIEMGLNDENNTAIDKRRTRMQSIVLFADTLSQT